MRVLLIVISLRKASICLLDYLNLVFLAMTGRFRTAINLNSMLLRQYI